MSGKQTIPNQAPVGHDYSSSPVVITVPLILVEYDGESVWYPYVMDHSAADRMNYAMNQSVNVRQVDVKVILPAACDVRQFVDDRTQLVSQPVRVQLKAG